MKLETGRYYKMERNKRIRDLCVMRVM